MFNDEDTKKSAESKKVAPDLKNIIAFTVLIISIFTFGLKGMATEMGIAVAGSLALLAFANLDKFDKFKAAGFEAELRKVVNEASATLDHLKAVATPLIIATLDVMSGSGRWDGLDLKKQNQIFDSLDEVRTSLGITDNLLRDTQLRFLNMQAWDMLLTVIQEQPELAGKREIGNAISSEIGQHNPLITPDIQKFEKFLMQHEVDVTNSAPYQEMATFYKKYKLNSL